MGGFLCSWAAPNQQMRERTWSQATLCSPGRVTGCGLVLPLDDTHLWIAVSSPRSVSPSLSGLKGKTSLYKQENKGGEHQDETQRSKWHFRPRRQLHGPGGTAVPCLLLSLSVVFSSTISWVCFMSLSSQQPWCPYCCFINSDIGSQVFLVSTVLRTLKMWSYLVPRHTVSKRPAGKERRGRALMSGHCAFHSPTWSRPSRSFIPATHHSPGHCLLQSLPSNKFSFRLSGCLSKVQPLPAVCSWVSSSTFPSPRVPSSHLSRPHGALYPAPPSLPAPPSPHWPSLQLTDLPPVSTFRTSQL